MQKEIVDGLYTCKIDISGAICLEEMEYFIGSIYTACENKVDDRRNFIYEFLEALFRDQSRKITYYLDDIVAIVKSYKKIAHTLSPIIYTIHCRDGKSVVARKKLSDDHLHLISLAAITQHLNITFEYISLSFTPVEALAELDYYDRPHHNSQFVYKNADREHYYVAYEGILDFLSDISSRFKRASFVSKFRPYRYKKVIKPVNV